MGTKKDMRRKTARRAYEVKTPKKGKKIAAIEIPVEVFERAMRAIRGKK